jgi:tRNA (guanine6-N2)-methyltransferase
MGRRAGHNRTYLLHCVPGLERTVSDELKGLPAPSNVTHTFERFDDRTSILLVQSGASPHDLLQLRTVEDVFVLASEIGGVTPAWAGIGTVRTALSRDRRLDAALALVRETRRARGRPTYRVIARVSGKQAFRRVDLQRAVEKTLAERLGGWRHVEDDAQVELWVHLVGETFLLGARLSDARMRHRTYLEASRRAALKPTIAAAMVMLTEPRPDDVFLDPMCGSGTILIERAQAERYALLLGGDADEDAVKAAHENIGPRYKPIQVRQWDARKLPLDDRSVSALACNLPFGKQVGTVAENRSLYPALLSEWARVLAPGARMVLLTSERKLLQDSLRRSTQFSLRRTVPVLVRGLPAAIFVVAIHKQKPE